MEMRATRQRSSSLISVRPAFYSLVLVMMGRESKRPTHTSFLFTDFDHFNTDTEDTVDSRSATKMTDGSEGSRRDGDSVEASEYDRGFKGGPPTSEEKIHH